MLPPEQFHIKRRREEEPVETLYIQSELHQTKRRFTDFIFQRVKIDSSGPTTPHDSAKHAGTSALSPAAGSAVLNDRLRSPRSVSTSGLQPRRTSRASAAAAATASGIPAIRATSPGAELRNERMHAEARRQDAEAKRKRLLEPISLFMPKSEAVETTPSSDTQAHGQSSTPASSISEKESNDSGRGMRIRPLSATPSAFPTSLRRFHIARPSASMDSLKGTAGSGVSKKPNTPTRARAILVEKLTRAPSLRGASVLQTLEKTPDDGRAELDTVAQSQLAQPPLQPPGTVLTTTRKRPVINQAEKKWREEQKTSISAAKEHLATNFQPRDDLDKLAAELEQVMLDIESEENHMADVHHDEPPKPAVLPQTPKAPLKYQPRNPGRRKAPVVPTTTSANLNEERNPDKTMQEADSDGEYVYDTYIRIPINTDETPRFPTKSHSDISGYMDPLAEANAYTQHQPYNIDPTRTDIGIVVITSDDQEIWDQYLEEDQDSEVDWDGDDVDSNAEDNPANDYPDEELSSADEFDEQPSIYRRYRSTASDDEEFDVNEYDDDDNDVDYKKYMYDYVGDDDDE